MKTAVMIVEDHPLFSRGLAQLIDAQSGFRVVGEAQNFEQALEILEKEKPELTVLDLNLGDEDGLELIKTLKSKDPEHVILVLSMHDERYYAERALRAGAKGYIMKEEAGDKVIDAIHTVMSGKIWLSEPERERLLDLSASGNSLTEGNDWFASIKKLSDRQLQIFTLIGKGLGTIEIATKLRLSPKTIDSHKEHIKLKLHCNSSQELRQLAIEWLNH